MKIRALVFVASLPLAACAVLFEETSQTNKAPEGDLLQSAWDAGAVKPDARGSSKADAGPPSLPDASPSPDGGLLPWGTEAGYVFLTAAVVNGRLGVAPSDEATGVGAGDDLCNREAGASPVLKGRRFAAYLSDDDHHARDRAFYNAHGWRQVNGAAVASSSALVWLQGDVTGAIASITQTATAQEVPGDVWTGSHADGTALFTCDNWTADTYWTRGTHFDRSRNVITCGGLRLQSFVRRYEATALHRSGALSLCVNTQLSGSQP